MDLVVHVLVGIFGFVLILAIFRDALRTVIIPRHGTRHAWFVRSSLEIFWRIWVAMARLVGKKEHRGYLSFYASLSLVLVLAPWAMGMIIGFALMQWAVGSQVLIQDGTADLGTILYMSGVTFLTLGYGDVVPVSPMARLLSVVEAGTGFAFLALVIGYVPVVYQAFTRRETPIPLLSEQIGIPLNTAGLLISLTEDGQTLGINEFLEKWSPWIADLMETHLSYPVLAYSRSESERSSWLAVLTLLLDTSALAMVGIESVPRLRARVTFAIGARCAMELARTLDAAPLPSVNDRLSRTNFEQLKNTLAAGGLKIAEGSGPAEELAGLRAIYEPHVNAIADRLLLNLPAWLPPAEGGQDSLRAA